MVQLNYEIWKDIPEYVGIYQASNQGRIRSLDRILTNGKKVKGKIMKQFINQRGNYAVGLRKDGKFNTFVVRRLVYAAFMGAIPDKYVIINLDGDQSDNRIENLAIFSKSEARTKLQSIFTDEEVKEIRRRLAENEYKIDLAREFNVSVSTITSLAKRETFSHIDDDFGVIECVRGPRGERHAASKLVEEDVLEIRQRAAQGERQCSIAIDFNIDTSTVSLICNRHRWKYLNDDLE
jgi:hypothetical protein